MFATVGETGPDIILASEIHFHPDAEPPIRPSVEGGDLESFLNLEVVGGVGHMYDRGEIELLVIGIRKGFVPGSEILPKLGNDVAVAYTTEDVAETLRYYGFASVVLAYKQGKRGYRPRFGKNKLTFAHELCFGIL